MRKIGSFNSGRLSGDRRWLFHCFAVLLVSVSLLLLTLACLLSPHYVRDSLSFDIISATIDDSDGYLIEPEDLKESLTLPSEAPRIAYLISGTKDESQRMIRTLQAVYHPRNQYILHLDLEAPHWERLELGRYVEGDPVFSEVGNVRVILNADWVTQNGPSVIASTLRAVAILLKEGVKWDWFINLSAADYPLMKQDDILHVFSSLPRDLNFIEHMKTTGWKLNGRARAIITDPGLYLSKKSSIVWSGNFRALPSAFNLFTGSGWVVLTRPFLEYCLWGWDNLPRTLLMYYANFVSSQEGYFHTVICNSDEFQNTTISHDLHYILWDNPPKQHPRSLTLQDFDMMVESGAPFARKFTEDDSVLDKIDNELLGRSKGQFTPGAWCTRRSDSEEDPCFSRGEDSIFLPGPGSKRLQKLMQKLLLKDFRNGSCSDMRYNHASREWFAP